MFACKRIVAVLVFMLALAMLLASATAGVGMLIVKTPLAEKAAYIYSRIETKLDIADEGLDHVQSSLSRAAERLDKVREEQRTLAQEPQKGDFAKRLIARTVQQQIAPDVQNAHEKLHAVAEAAVVVNSVLEDLGNFPLLSVAGINLDGLTDMNSDLSRVESSAWELLRLLGEPGTAADADTATRMSQVDQTVGTVQGHIAEYKLQVTEVRQRTTLLKSWTLPWITPTAIIVSVICFWIALSQISVLVHAVKLWKFHGGNI
jgi:hypothetical protein